MRAFKAVARFFRNDPRASLIREATGLLVLSIFIFMVMSVASIGAGLVTAWRVGAL